MNIRIGRILLLGIGAEILAIATLVLIVAVFGPRDPEGARAFAQELGYWVGPIAGFVFCFAGGWLAARGLASHHVLNGTALGLFVAFIDVALLVLGGAGFEPIFVVSNLGRIVAGSLGGWLAGKGSRRAA